MSKTVSFVISEKLKNSISFYCNNFGIKKSDFFRIAIEEKLNNKNNVEEEINKLASKKLKKMVEEVLKKYENES